MLLPAHVEFPLLHITESCLAHRLLSSRPPSPRMPSTAFPELTLAQLWQGVCEPADQLLAWEPTGELKLMCVSRCHQEDSSEYGKSRENIITTRMRKSQTVYKIVSFLVSIREQWSQSNQRSCIPESDRPFQGQTRPRNCFTFDRAWERERSPRKPHT